MEKPTAPFILDKAAGHLRDRAAIYDSPGGERSAGKTARAFNAITGNSLSAGDVYLLLGILKAVRSRQGAFKLDNYEDAAAYFALMGEEDCKKASKMGRDKSFTPEIAHEMLNQLAEKIAANA